MRLFVAATLAASLVTTTLLAAETAPLPAGKPAGVQKAQDAGDDTLLWALGITAVVGGVIAISNGSDTPPPTTT